MEKHPEGTSNDCIRIDCIRIDSPPDTNDEKPLCVTLDNRSCFVASGGTDDPNIISIDSVQGQIAGTSIRITGSSTGVHWTIPGLGPLVAGQVYQLLVTATVYRNDSSEPTPCSNCVSFIAVNDSHSYPSGHSPTEESVFARVMPRYFRIRLQEEIPSFASPAGSWMLGGLLEPCSVHLAYDSDASTLATPVWRDINLPEYIGRWTLRVTQSRCGSNAELIQQTLGPREVRAPMTLRCDKWSFRGPNVFVPAHSAHGDAAAVPLPVVVEPA